MSNNISVTYTSPVHSRVPGWVVISGDAVSDAMPYDEALKLLEELGVSRNEARSGLLTAEDMPAPSRFFF
jgi:hypothetical protein